MRDKPHTLWKKVIVNLHYHSSIPKTTAKKGVDYLIFWKYAGTINPVSTPYIQLISFLIGQNSFVLSNRSYQASWIKKDPPVPGVCGVNGAPGVMGL